MSLSYNIAKKTGKFLPDVDESIPVLPHKSIVTSKEIEITEAEDIGEVKVPAKTQKDETTKLLIMIVGIMVLLFFFK